MMGEQEKRPSISTSDFKMRLFVDTNVLVDSVEERDEKKAKSFIELFRNSSFDNIELVTSDYVLWEFFSHFRDELYIRKLIDKHKYWNLSANKECKRGTFKKAVLQDMKNFGDIIKGYVQQFSENPVSIQRLIGKNSDGFSELIEEILRSSKFSYQDSIVFVSALHTISHIIITYDETFSSETHLQDLREALKSVPSIRDIEFKKPEDFSSETNAKKEYCAWFLKQNQSKKIGQVFYYYPKKKVICVQCINNYSLRENDYVYLVKYNEASHEILKRLIQIKKGNLRDFKTRKPIEEGKKVTIGLPEDFSIDIGSLKNAMVFISE
jgi:predicted nucleic acid-binding protein